MRNKMDLTFVNENLDLRNQIQDIKEKILFILDEIHHNRYYLNKHFQNCMVNYFLKNLNFPFLSQSEPGYSCSKTMNNAILKKYVNLDGAIYLRLLKGYLQEIQNQGKLAPYRETLLQMIIQQNSTQKHEKKDENQNSIHYLKQNKDYLAEIWKKAFSLFILFHSYNSNVKGIFEIWNCLFPQDQIKRKRKQNISHVIIIPYRKQIIQTNNIEQKENQQQDGEEDRIEDGKNFKISEDEEHISKNDKNSLKDPDIEVKSEQFDIHNYIQDDEDSESENTNIQESHFDMKLKRSPHLIESEEFEQCSFGRKKLKNQEQSNSTSIQFPLYLSDYSLHITKETASTETININTFSSSDLQINSGHVKKEEPLS